MLLDLFFRLKEEKLPVTITEYLALLDVTKHGLANYSVDDFYVLARTCLVKDEALYDRFDKVYGEYVSGVEAVAGKMGSTDEIPEEWLRKMAEKHLSQEEMDKIQSLGGFEELMETLKKRLEEQKERHQGGNKWIGTGGTSPFGAHGYNPEGIRIGQKESRHRRAVKVWDKREFRNLDNNLELGTRNIKVALKRLRQFARTGAQEELDLDDTIRSTARNAGLLDIKMQRERHNAVKVLIFFDIGGSMDDHIRVCEELFSAVHGEFKHLEYYYFHNFIYEGVWKNNERRFDAKVPTTELLHKYGQDYKVIFVGDATMSPYEIEYPGGSVEHWNKEPGSYWMKEVTKAWKNVIWLNPVDERWWDHTPSVVMTKDLVAKRMFPLTVQGIDQGIKCLMSQGARS